MAVASGHDLLDVKMQIRKRGQIDPEELTGQRQSTNDSHCRQIVNQQRVSSDFPSVKLDGEAPWIGDRYISLLASR